MFYILCYFLCYNITHVSRQVGEELSKDIAKLTKEKNDAAVAKNKEFEACTQFSADLDNLNIKLQHSLEKLQNHLYNFKYVSYI